MTGASILIFTWDQNHLECLSKICQGTSLVVQWLGLCASNAGVIGTIPGWETKILHAAWPKKFKNLEKIQSNRTVLGVRWLRLPASSAGVQV